MTATLHDVRDRVVEFNDSIMLGHVDPGITLEARTLLACFGTRQRPFADRDTIVLAPARGEAHPRGTLIRMGREDLRTIGLAPWLCLGFRARFACDYKLVVSGYAVAVRLGFEPDDAPVVTTVVDTHRVAAIVLDKDRITIYHAGGVAEVAIDD